MRNLVIAIETILFLIFIATTGLGIETAMEIEANIPLQRWVFTFFSAIIFLSILIAVITIIKTIKLFKGNTLGVIDFIKQKIKQDKKFILLILLIILEIVLTLFWLLVVSLIVYFIIGFDTDNGFLGNQKDMPNTIIIYFGSYFTFLCASYFVLYGFLNILLEKSSFILPYFVMLVQLFITNFILDKGLIPL